MRLNRLKNLFRTAAAAILLVFCLSAAPKFEPADSYDKQTIEGWTVYVSRDLRDDHETAERVLKLLGVQLFQITRAVPGPALGKLREVPIWAERKDRDIACMCYHPSADWLREHGYNPEKAGGVEIGNAETFLSWTHEQPWMVLHELAHAYHDRVLGFENAEVKAAYDAAVKSH